MKIINNPHRKNWTKLLKRPTFTTTSLEGTVKEVFDEVKKNGDNALRKYTQRFDNIVITDFQNVGSATTSSNCSTSVSPKCCPKGRASGP